ncbi:LysR family transcriptional regulator [Roseobacter weihaiensis]|uniref:LysR substrate-binding domain-containing protein n=1 Tax=Roseobacter weihaiensis TaxID=2763262 RepID=UPI001D0A34CB|nr:LysR substrate-binding domain-containing protein [Roseobacter sp. H9]
MAIELKQLQYVVEAAEHQSFRGAAEAVGVNQSAISRRIRDLEDALGASLFNRHSGGVVLTVAGRKFVRHARRALNEVSFAKAYVGCVGRGEEGQVRIGISSSLAAGFLAELLREYASQHRKVAIDIIEGIPKNHLAAVRLRKLDVAFIADTPSIQGCDSVQLWKERIFVTLQEGHRLARHEVLSWNDLQEERFVVSRNESGIDTNSLIVERLAELDARPKIDHYCVGRGNLMQLVSFGLGITVTNESAIAAQFPGVVHRRLDDEILYFSAVWSPVNDNPAWRRMLSLVRVMVHDLDLRLCH